LTRQSFELEELQRAFQQKDTKVLIDLGRVTKIDSAGLGQLMSCYSHAVKNQGILKLLNPTAEVQSLLRLTKIDSVLETYYDERQALRSFELA
jgi:anti-sigma B factor antagonist